MNNLYNTIALQYKQSVVIEKSTHKISALYIRGLLLDISQLGYTLNTDVLGLIRTFSEVEFKNFHEMLISNLKEMVGANVKYTALFKDFPNNIPDDDEYFIKRFVGFITNEFNLVPDDIEPLSCGHVINTSLFNLNEFGVCPICQQQVDELNDDESDRPALEDITPLKIIKLTDEENVKQIFTNLLAANASISQNHKLIIKEMIKQDPSMFTCVPNVIPIKENLAVIAGLAIQYKHDGNGIDFSHVASDILVNNIKTATDVLRTAVQLCNGDVSLATPTRFKLTNSERKVIMWLLNEVNSPAEDMLRYKMRWIRLAEVLHIGKYANKFPNAFIACDTLRNHADKIETFNSKVEALVTQVNKGSKVSEDRLVKLLIVKPGEFTRRMDWMIRTFSKNSIVITAFSKLIDKLTTSMLLTVSSHFKHRFIDIPNRYFMPKGNLAKIQVIKDERDVIDEKITLKIMKLIKTELLSRFSKLDNLGNVYINPELKNYLVPLVQRNASKSLTTVARGSQIPLMETKAARMFMYWKQNADTGTVDVDLSAILFDSNWNYISHVSYTNLSCVGGKHSGDIQSAPDGASEFIDIDIMAARQNNVRYVVMDVISYTHQPFDTFECFAGVMERDSVDSGKKFEPTTVVNKFDVAGDTQYNIPLILDLKTNKIIWADVALSSRINAKVESAVHLTKITKSIQSMIDDKPNMFDLLMLHVKARSESVDVKFNKNKKYDVKFDIDMASNIDDILANWL